MTDPAAAKQVPVLAALAQPTRLRILSLVAEAGPLGVAAGELAKVTRCPPSTLSFHLKELSRTGILEPRPRGRYMIYALRREVLEDLAGFLTELAGATAAPKARRARAERGGKRPRAGERAQLSMFAE